jgi:hypothetical protein
LQRAHDNDNDDDDDSQRHYHHHYHHNFRGRGEDVGELGDRLCKFIAMFEGFRLLRFGWLRA